MSYWRYNNTKWSQFLQSMIKFVICNDYKLKSTLHFMLLYLSHFPQALNILFMVMQQFDKIIINFNTIPFTFKNSIKRLVTYYKLTLNASFSKKCEIPLGYATSYLDPESITTEIIKKINKYAYIVI